jgi:hypothetical protein
MMIISQWTSDNDSKNRKITMEIVIMIVVDSVYAVNLKIWRKKIFSFFVVVVWCSIIAQ